jgi:uncharacterized OB-fold protein
MEVPRHYRTRHARYALTGSVCNDCGAHAFPPRDLCEACGHDALSPFRFSGRGQVYTYSTIRQAPEGFTQFVPYTVALVTLQEGPVVSAQLTDVEPEAVSVGMDVEMVTRKVSEDGADGVIVYGYKFRPVVQVGQGEQVVSSGESRWTGTLSSRPPSGLPA